MVQYSLHFCCSCCKVQGVCSPSISAVQNGMFQLWGNVCKPSIYKLSTLLIAATSLFITCFILSGSWSRSQWWRSFWTQCMLTTNMTTIVIITASATITTAVALAITIPLLLVNLVNQRILCCSTLFTKIVAAGDAVVVLAAATDVTNMWQMVFIYFLYIFQI